MSARDSFGLKEEKPNNCKSLLGFYLWDEVDETRTRNLRIDSLKLWFLNFWGKSTYNCKIKTYGWISSPVVVECMLGRT